MTSHHQHQPEPVCARGHVKPAGRGTCYECRRQRLVEKGIVTGYKARMSERAKDPNRTCRSGKHVIGEVGTMSNGGCAGCWRERTGHQPRDFNGMCRKGIHRLFERGKLTKFCRETPKGFYCLGCARRRAAKRRQRLKLTHMRVPCFAAVAVPCKSATNRVKSDKRPYLCPVHRRQTPAVVLKLLKLQGYVPVDLTRRAA